MTPQLPPLTRRQHDILTFFITYRESQGISPTLEEIARNFGLNKVTVFGHIAELERKGVISRSAKGISRGLQLVSFDDRPTQLPISGTIAAGAPIQANECEESFNFADLFQSRGEVYALRVKGDSMVEDGICDGDLVLVEHRSHAKDGEIVVAILPGEEATLKRLYHEKGRTRLQPANSQMRPLFSTDVQVRGVVIGVVRKY